jgi:hypothetical protein
MPRRIAFAPFAFAWNLGPGHDSSMQTQTQSIVEASDLLAFAEVSLAALRRGGERLAALADAEDERLWLGAAQRKVELRTENTRTALDAAFALPEFESERLAKGQALFAAWVESIEALFNGIVAHVSDKNPLIETLFPHLKFDKLRRGGTAARAFKTELERRRGTTYVMRLATEPEYAFLPALLAKVDGARDELASHEKPSTATELELTELRHGVLSHADALRVALAQARLLAEAALIAQPGVFQELGLDAKPRKRASRGSSAPGDPAGPATE